MYLFIYIYSKLRYTHFSLCSVCITKGYCDSDVVSRDVHVALTRFVVFPVCRWLRGYPLNLLNHVQSTHLLHFSHFFCEINISFTRIHCKELRFYVGTIYYVALLLCMFNLLFLVTVLGNVI